MDALTRSKVTDVALLIWQWSPLYGVGLVLSTGGGALLLPGYGDLAGRLPTIGTGLYWLDGLIFLVLFDLVEYAIHRWVQHSRWLWWLHRWHHNGATLWIGTATRNHPAWFAVQELWRLPLMVLLGGAEHVWWWAPLLFAHQMWTHCGRDWGLGPLEGWVVSPRWHAVHHHDSGNYASALAVWDRLFGSHCELSAQ